jgi:leader peptidase (prepilin peptidase)/N-methyltransferase
VIVLVAVAVAVAVGAVYGRLPATVAARVFQEPDTPLLTRTDLRNPLGPEPASPQLAIGVHIVSALLLGAAALAIGERWVLVAYLWFVAVTLTLTLTDLDRKLIPNRILFPGLVVGVVLLALGALADGDMPHLLRALAGAAGYFAFLFVLALLARGGFGMGDVKLGALLGAFLAYEGWDVLVVGAVGAFLLGGVVSIFLLVFRIRGRKDAIPFGPYLVLGAYVAIAAGEAISEWYTG